MDLTKKQIVELGLSLGVDYSMTTSCYDPGAGGVACGRCDACQLRLRGFHEAGVNDPAAYAI
jgi:7-cyano-7-deazaguanine synthase